MHFSVFSINSRRRSSSSRTKHSRLPYHSTEQSTSITFSTSSCSSCLVSYFLSWYLGLWSLSTNSLVVLVTSCRVLGVKAQCMCRLLRLCLWSLVPQGCVLLLQFINFELQTHGPRHQLFDHPLHGFHTIVRPLLFSLYFAITVVTDVITLGADGEVHRLVDTKESR